MVNVCEEVFLVMILSYRSHEKSPKKATQKVQKLKFCNEKLQFLAGQSCFQCIDQIVSIYVNIIKTLHLHELFSKLSGFQELSSILRTTVSSCFWKYSFCLKSSIRP